MGLSDAIELAKIFGPQLVLLGFFVWWSFVREKAIAKRLNEVENARVEDLNSRGQQHAGRDRAYH